MGDKTVVGVSVGYHDFGDYQGVGFQRPIALAGGVPLILSRVEGTLSDVLDVLDAVVIAGGRDIEPHRYGQEPHELLARPIGSGTSSSWSSSSELCQAPDRRRVPGIQVLNVALGGALVRTSASSGVDRTPDGRGWHRWKEVGAPRSRTAGRAGASPR
jgi:gamma-glutamyl-gamma-aminobutyrate hydrolase PuuD